MKWKRCSICNDLKTIDNFYKKYDGYSSACKKCIKEKNIINKDIKKEYDRKRYLKKKKEKQLEDIVCMRCDLFYANVKNNQLYWCFHCLEKYEKELKQSLKVEVIRKTMRRVDIKNKKW